MNEQTVIARHQNSAVVVEVLESTDPGGHWLCSMHAKQGWSRGCECHKRITVRQTSRVTKKVERQKIATVEQWRAFGMGARDLAAHWFSEMNAGGSVP